MAQRPYQISLKLVKSISWFKGSNDRGTHTPTRTQVGMDLLFSLRKESSLKIELALGV
jgi:hypothetical protein